MGLRPEGLHARGFSGLRPESSDCSDVKTSSGAKPRSWKVDTGRLRSLGPLLKIKTCYQSLRANLDPARAGGLIGEWQQVLVSTCRNQTARAGATAGCTLSLDSKLSFELRLFLSSSSFCNNFFFFEEGGEGGLQKKPSKFARFLRHRRWRRNRGYESDHQSVLKIHTAPEFRRNS